MVENNVSMMNRTMNLFFKRFRSKAPSAASLPSGLFYKLQKSVIDFCLLPDTKQSLKERGI